MGVLRMASLGLVLFGSLCAAELIGGLRHGRVSSTAPGLSLLRPPIRREVHPVSFWLTMAFDAFGLCISVGVLVSLVVGAF